MKEKDIRQSNFELMRIISMFYIAFLHFFCHGKMFDKTSGYTNIIVICIAALLVVHVNSFVLLSGYFNYDKEFKLSKIIRLNNSMWFYNFLWVIIAMFVFSISFSNAYILDMISIIPRYNNFWFVVVYMLLYLVSPILNMIIRNIDKKQHKTIIIALLIVTTLCFITYDNFYGIKKGYSLFSFIMLYFIGAYLHKYPIDKNKIFKSSKSKVLLFAISLYVISGLINIGLHYLGVRYINSSHEIVRNYSYVLKTGFFDYFNPIVIFGTIGYFLIFSQLNIKSKIINFYGKYVLGVYLLTDNTIARILIYKKLGFNLKSYTLKHVLLAFIISIGMVLVLPVIEFIRSKVYKFFYNRKLAKKNRVFIQNCINKLGLSVKW